MDLLVALATFVVAVGLASVIVQAILQSKSGFVNIAGHATNATLVSGIGALISATAITIVALSVWQSAIFERRLDRGTAPPQEPEKPPQKGDGSVYRVGWLGGDPSPFLDPSIASEIAELVGYRHGDPEPKRIDVRRTMSERVRGGDPALMYMEPRRELPTILLLVDTRSDAHRWNTLPTEFEKTVTSWGVPVERIDYPGSLFSRVGREPSRPAEALLVEEILASPGWTVTTIFGEAHRFARSDVDLLGRIAENGPVLFLEFRDPRQWNAAQVAVRKVGVQVVPATGQHLRDGLARLFAPDRVTEKNQAAPPNRAQKQEKPTSSPEDQLGEDVAAWAGACALVEPISFALAERLRRLYPSLGPPEPVIFSCLTNYPGARFGPEGLRFEGHVRRDLINFFSKRPQAERAKAITAIDDAFKQTPANGITAEAVRRFSQAQVHIYNVTPDGALYDIEDILEEGLLSNRPIRDFRARLATPANFSDADQSRPQIFRSRRSHVRQQTVCASEAMGTATRLAPDELSRHAGRSRRPKCDCAFLPLRKWVGTRSR